MRCAFAFAFSAPVVVVHPFARERRRGRDSQRHRRFLRHASATSADTDDEWRPTETDYDAQKRKRLSWMPRLWTNDAAKHRTEDALGWQKERQERMAKLETVRFGAGAFVGEGVEIFAEPGRNVVVGEGSAIAAYGFIHGPCAIGSNVSINARCHIEGGSVGISIGDDTRIGPFFNAYAFDHIFEDPNTPVRLQGVTSRGIIIGKDVWIGANVSVTDGVTIGDHSVVGIGTVVTRDVEPYAVVAGNPARVIKYRRRPKAPDRPRPSSSSPDPSSPKGITR